ncbi:uncharacterized protein LOC120294255 [Eucalyptus grandis]|uniref:uncharacterized protein LOC120294255 n=1 Tax=Eucalyptus grandis TaxID=71139 RepID=UPI00192ECB15|nr:uncharacterized protein LOC120294255 [Eucalyptus grandis]
MTKSKQSVDLGHFWQPPAPGTLRINIDGAYTSGHTEGSIAFICRDKSGCLQEGLTRSVQAASALQTEAQALIFTLRHLLQQGKMSTSLEIDLDCLLLVDSLNNQQEPPWEICPLVYEAVDLCRQFLNLNIRFCKRETNSVADWAAKAHSNGTLSPSWAVSPPPPFLSLLISDTVAAACISFPYL